jgi:photosystem II stability/assembly factor-like uncharacterized protein
MQNLTAMKVSTRNLKHSSLFLPALLIITVAVWAQSTGFSIQISSAPSEAEAQALVAGLKSNGLEAYWVKAVVSGKGTRYRVRIGRFGNQSAAKAAAERMLGRGLIKEYIITNYETPSSITSSLKEAKTRPVTLPKSKQIDLARTEERSVTGGGLPQGLPSEERTDGATTSPANTNTRSRTVSTNTKSPTAKEIARADEIKKAEPKSTDKENKSSLPAPTGIMNGNGVPAPTANPDVSIITPPIPDSIADDAANSNWRVVRRSAETDKNLRSIYFVDSMTGWAAGDAGSVYRTTDGGRTWKPLLIGTAANIGFMYFIDWNNGWMLGETTGKNFESSEMPGETILFMTNNGGRTWTNKPLPNVLSLHFIDAKNGWAVGKDATLLKTTDGGEQWIQSSGLDQFIGLPVESSTYNYGFRDIFFLNAKQGWMIGNFYGRARSNIGGLFVTSDGGNNWKRIPLTLQTQYSSGRFTPGELQSVHFTDPNTGSVTGEMLDGEGRFFFVLHTRDGGKTWEQFRTPSRAVHSTQFLDLSNGWMAATAPREGGAEAIIYDTTLMRTDNGGMSWQNDFTTRGRRIRGVFFISPTKGWAVGDRGMILRYEEKPKT